jgi:translation elongation factor EF-4
MIQYYSSIIAQMSLRTSRVVTARMKRVGRVEIPQGAFLAVLEVTGDEG